MKLKHIALTTLILTVLVGCNEPNRIVSDGERVGIVRKLSLKENGAGFRTGTLPRSWEGELDMSLPGTAGGEVWLFSIDPQDNSAVEQVKTAQRSRKVVILQYRQSLRIPTDNAPQSGCSCIGPNPLQGTLYNVYAVQSMDGTPQPIEK